MLKNAIISGIYTDVAESKGIIKRAVIDRDNTRFVCSCVMYKSLSLYINCIKSVQMWNWWHYTRIRPNSAAKCKLIARILLSETCFSNNTYRFKTTNGSVLCNLCNKYCAETGHHVLFECEHGCELRQELLRVIKDEAPEQLWHEIMNGNKMVLFLTCFGSAPVNEWLSFYDAVIDFFYKMYKQRSDVKRNLLA
jgi:hypothetical protein